jgi:hypothetical protein
LQQFCIAYRDKVVGVFIAAFSLRRLPSTLIMFFNRFEIITQNGKCFTFCFETQFSIIVKKVIGTLIPENSEIQFGVLL